MSWAETKTKCSRVLLSLLGSEAVEGRVRLHKTFFLLKELGLPELEELEFDYHHYGPFSAALAQIVDEGVAADWVAEERDFGDDWQKFHYELTDQGRSELEVATLPDGSLTLISSLVARTKDSSWRSLELAATARYLEEAEATREAAMQRALRLKPSCHSFEAEARELLADLDELEEDRGAVEA